MHAIQGLAVYAFFEICRYIHSRFYHYVFKYFTRNSFAIFSILVQNAMQIPTYLFTILEETWILDLCFRCLNQRQSFRILLRSESNKPFYLGLLWSVTNCGRDGQKLDSLRFKKHHNYLLLLSE